MAGKSFSRKDKHIQTHAQKHLHTHPVVRWPFTASLSGLLLVGESPAGPAARICATSGTGLHDRSFVENPISLPPLPPRSDEGQKPALVESDRCKYCEEDLHH